MVKRVAMQKEGEPSDVASAIAFLCSERARYITGAVLTVTAASISSRSQGVDTNRRVIRWSR